MSKYRKGFYGILLLTLTMLFGMTAQAKTDDTIKTGIYAGDVELSGMTAQEATAVIEEHIEGLKDVEITLLAANDHDVTTTAGIRPSQFIRSAVTSTVVFSSGS